VVAPIHAFKLNAPTAACVILLELNIPKMDGREHRKPEGAV
jgi:hypothetical protein